MSFLMFARPRLRTGAIPLVLLLAGTAPAAAENGAPPSMDREAIERISARAQALPRLHSLIVAQHGTVLIAQAYRGPGLDVPVNVKSVAKSVVSALVGIAIDRGLIDGVTQPVAALLPADMPRGGDPRLEGLTLEHLLSMQAGLERTSGHNYGRWIASGNWVRYVLSRPFVDAPGGRMLYSTGNTHVVSAILTRASGATTHTLANRWLAAPLGFEIPPWQRDPQGLYLGGNNMAIPPRGLLRFGELYRNGGVHDGRRILPKEWIEASWTPRTMSYYSGDGYGYGWFVAEFCGAPAHYARGFGGQFVYVSPAAGLTIVMTSDPTVRTRVDGYYDDLRSLIADEIFPAALRARGTASDGTQVDRSPRSGHC